ncbi:potassium-transporting ATPase subunit KdpC [soil metagenome]
MALKASIRPAIALIIFFTVLLGIAYPLATTGIAQVIFGDRADGSLVEENGAVVGSTLIGQSFIDPETNAVVPGYFRGRPSASNYDGMASGGSNYGPTNQLLIDRVAELTALIRTENGMTADQAMPIDLVTTSASGLDPDISPASAELQVNRVAQERGITAEQVQQLIDDATSKPTLGFMGEERVNVFELNKALDDQYPLAS